MNPTKINRMILDKIKSKQLPHYVEGFIREILQHEQKKLDQTNPRYTQRYSSLIDKYIQKMDISKDSDL